MGMSVNPVSERVVNLQPKKAEPKDYVKTGAKIGAGVGVGVSALNYTMQRGLVKICRDALFQQGFSKAMTYGTIAGALVVGVALMAGFGSLIGAGVGKIVDHFKKPKEQEPQKIY